MKSLSINSDAVSSIIASIISILIGIAFGFVILLITDPSRAFEGLLRIFAGGFTGGAKGVGQVLYLATPLIMTGLSVGFAFKTGLFNIGASGQFTVGGAVAILIGVNMEMASPFHWIFAIIMAAVAGFVWGLIPGLLKAYCNVHEVIASIMMNYIGMYLGLYLVRTRAYNAEMHVSADIADTATLPKAGLDVIFSTTIGNFTDSSAVSIGVVISIILAIIVHIVINKTTFGYELKACGHNPQASKYAGINAKRNIVLAMAIAGMLAGIGGALVYLTGEGGRNMQIIEELAAEGFNGIPVALLGLSHPIGIIFSALFVAYLTQGGSYLQMIGYMPELIDIMIACIIYFSAFSLLFRQYFGKRIDKLISNRMAGNPKKRGNSV